MAARKAREGHKEDADRGGKKRAWTMQTGVRAAYPTRRSSPASSSTTPTGITVMLPYFRPASTRDRSGQVRRRVLDWIAAFLVRRHGGAAARAERGAKTPMGSWHLQRRLVRGDQKTAARTSPRRDALPVERVAEGAQGAVARADVVTQWAEVFGAENVPATVALGVQLLTKEGSPAHGSRRGSVHRARARRRDRGLCRRVPALGVRHALRVRAEDLPGGAVPRVRGAGRILRSGEKFRPVPTLKPDGKFRPCEETETGAGYDPARFLRRAACRKPAPAAGQVFWVLEHFRPT